MSGQLIVIYKRQKYETVIEYKEGEDFFDICINLLDEIETMLMNGGIELLKEFLDLNIIKDISKPEIRNKKSGILSQILSLGYWPEKEEDNKFKFVIDLNEQLIDIVGLHPIYKGRNRNESVRDYVSYFNIYNIKKQFKWKCSVEYLIKKIKTQNGECCGQSNQSSNQSANQSADEITDEEYINYFKIIIEKDNKKLTERQKENLMKMKPSMEVKLRTKKKALQIIETQKEDDYFLKRILEKDKEDENKERTIKNNKVLVMCATNETVLDNEWEKIINNVNRNINPKINTNDFEPYYIGLELNQLLPFRVQDKAINIENHYKDIKFDIIISEYCPKNVFNKECVKSIHSLLSDDGLYIIPNYKKFDFSVILEKFEVLFENDNNVCYTKKQ
jgi:hypothetical protein